MTFFPDDNGGLIPLKTQRRYLPNSRTRIWELDFLRGICVILMVLDHAAMLIDYFSPSWYGIYGWYAQNMGNALTRFCYQWTNGDIRLIVHNVVLVIFFGISGISCTFSRSNRKRGALLMIVALLYTMVTIFDEEVLGISGEVVTFGVLHFLAVCILLYALIDFLCRRDARSVSICSLGIMAITLILYFCYTPPASTPIYFAFLFPPEDFWGNLSLFYRQFEVSPGDLFTVIPYAAYFFWGAVVAPFIYSERKSLLPRLDGKWNKPLSFIGRHALIFFLLHIPVIAGILALVSYFFVTPGSFGF